MSGARKRQDAVLAAAWAQVPAMADCKGLCHDSCGPIPVTVRERQRLHIATGVSLPTVEEGLAALDADRSWSCPVLDPETKLCRGYEVRPLICRLYGATEMLPCAYGCTTVGEPLTNEQAQALIARVTEETGGLYE